MADPTTNPTTQATGAVTSAPGDDADKVVAATLADPNYVNAPPDKQQLVRNILREKYITNRAPGGTTFKNLPPSLQSPNPPLVDQGKIDAGKSISGITSETPGEKFIRSFGGSPDYNEESAIKDPSQLGKLLAPMGAMLATAGAGPEAGFMRSLFRAFLGGSAGEGINQTGQAVAGTKEAPQKFSDVLSEVGTSGATQMGMEALGRVLMYPFQKLLGGIKGNSPASPAEIADKTFNLGLTPGQQTGSVGPRSLERMAEHNVAGFSAAEPYREDIAKRATQAAEDVTGRAFGSSPVDMAGARTQDAITNIGSPAFKSQVGKLSNILSAITYGKTVDISDMKQTALDELKEISTLQNRPIDPVAAAAGSELKTAKPSSGREAILTDILNLKDNPTFEDLRNLRSKWMAIGPQSTELLSNEAQGAAKRYTQLATQALDKSVAGNPAEQSAWNAFRNFTRKGAEVMDSSNINSMINSDPEKVATQLGPNDLTKARQIKRAVLTYAQQYADPKDAQSAALTWDKFRGAYIRQQLLSGDLGTLSDRIKQADPVIRTLFDDAKGKSTISNLSLIGDAMAKMDVVSERGVGTRWQVIKAIPATMVVNMAYNPAATRFFVRGLNGLMKDSQYSAAQAVGSASTTATPYLGNAMADILRAMQMTQTIQDSGKSPNPNQPQGVQ